MINKITLRMLKIFLIVFVWVGATPSFADYPLPDQWYEKAVRDNLILHSNWLENVKELYQKALASSKADILVVPVQVQGFAFDESERSLITRQVVGLFEKYKNYAVVDTSILTEALGGNQRRFNEKLVYALAEKLRVDRVVWLYSGHNRDLQMVLTVFDDALSYDGVKLKKRHRKHKTWKEISFSDEQPPSFALNSVRDELKEFLGVGERNKKRVKKIDLPKFPLTLNEIMKGRNRTSFESGVLLQLMAVLVPDKHGQYSSFLLEKSIIALNHSNNESELNNVLVARSLGKLNKRPAALRRIGEPVSPFGKAVLAYLNGDYVNMERLIGRIDEPLLKMLSIEDYYEVGNSYFNTFPFEAFREFIESLKGEVGFLAKNRMSHFDEWYRGSNISAVIYLEDTFRSRAPLDLELKRKALSGGVEGVLDEELFAASHVHSVVSANANWCCEARSWEISDFDVLSVYDALIEIQTLDKVTYEIFVQGSYEKALKLIERLERIYKDHPILTYYKSLVTLKLARHEKGLVGDVMKKDAIGLLLKTYYWMGGQSNEAKQVVDVLTAGKQRVFPIYNSDFPRKPYWFFNYKLDRELAAQASSDIEQENALVSMKYSKHNMAAVGELYGLNSGEQFNLNFEEVFRGRFSGSPVEVEVYLKVCRESNDWDPCVELLEKTIESAPHEFDNYSKLSSVYVLMGESDKVVDLFGRYEWRLHENYPTLMVGVSNYLYKAAHILEFLGYQGEALRYYEMSSQLNTGSESSLRASFTLAMEEERYEKAAFILKRMAPRYKVEAAYSKYIDLLFLMNKKKEGESLFGAQKDVYTSRKFWSNHVLRLRMNGFGHEEIVGYFEDYAEEHEGNVEYASVYSALLEGSEDLLAESIEAYETRDNIGFTAVFNAMAAYGESDWGGTVDAVIAYLDTGDRQSDLYRSALFYYLKAILNMGKTELFDSEVQRYGEYHGLYRKLSEFYRFVKGGEFDLALVRLDQALLSTESPYLVVDPLAQIIMVLDEAYNISRHEAFRKRMLGLASIYRREAPANLLGYVVRAKYGVSPLERSKALAKAMAIDGRAGIMRQFSHDEVDKALEYSSRNSMFSGRAGTAL